MEHLAEIQDGDKASETDRDNDEKGTPCRNNPVAQEEEPEVGKQARVETEVEHENVQIDDENQRNKEGLEASIVEKTDTNSRAYAAETDSDDGIHSDTVQLRVLKCRSETDFDRDG